MKKQVFYIHGGESYSDYKAFLRRLETKDIWDLPGSNSKKWTQSLAKDLGDDFEVFTPRMPNSNNAKYTEWKIWFERHFELLRDDVVFIGCSLGAMFLYKYFIENKAPMKVRALMLMASPANVEDFDFSDEDCGDFVFELTDVPKMVGKAEYLYIIHSEDDFLVPYSHGEKLAAALPEAEFVSFTDKNHFLVPELPELIDLIKKVS